MEVSTKPGPSPRVVLVRPLYGGNVGATCRAMANTGLEELHLVDATSKHLNADESQRMARGSLPLLESAPRWETVGQAVQGCTAVVACTARPRRWKAWKVLDPSDAAVLLREHGAEGSPTALLFGSEDSGLTQADLAWATHLCHIPTGEMHSSLNLAQAVLLLGWEWARLGSDLHRRPHRTRRRGNVPIEQVQGTVEQLASLLDRIDFFRGRNR